jgi:HAD superfamily phosphoserine phosphatase-like hydrolase
LARWAVFDIDGTLFSSTSMEKKFIYFMLKKGVLPLPNVFLYLLYSTYKLFQQNYPDAFKSNKYYLHYLPVNKIQNKAVQYTKKVIWPNISDKGKETIREYSENKYKIFIMSGSPDFLTLQLCNFIRPDFIVSSKLEIKNHRFTGKLNNLHPYGARKTKILKELKKELDIDFDSSIVFANHHSDIDHMKLFKEKVAVNPTHKLKKYAQKNQWRIEKW